MAFDWKKAIGGIAPTLASMLVPGGPAVKAAVQAISNAVLGKPDGTETEVQQALRNGASAEQLAALVSAENAFKIKMQEIGVDLAKLEVEDRGSARARQIALHDWVPSVLGGVIILGFLGMATAVLAGKVDMHDASVIGVVGTVIGYVSAKADTVVGYYFGSSLGSRLKDQQKE